MLIFDAAGIVALQMLIFNAAGLQIRLSGGSSSAGAFILCNNLVVSINLCNFAARR
jgi:hypothetical protein